MKNIHTILSELGISIPEDKKAEFDRAVAENYKTIVEHEKKVDRLSEDLTEMTTRATTAENTLKGFEGKDFDAITRERDEWKQKHDTAVAEYQRQQEEREFTELLSSKIAESKGKNAKAITALLDLDALRSSKNRDNDIKAALDALRTESGYLFDDNGGTPRFAAGGGSPQGGAITKKDIMAIKDPAERQAKIAANIHLFQKG